MSAVLIRAWGARHTALGYAIAEFDDGEFTVTADHPLSEIAFADPHGDCPISFFTVLETEELQWRLVEVQVGAEGVTRFISRPWISELRRQIESDQAFIERVVEKGSVL